MNRIPKKLHLYWDKSPMSKLQVFTVETFHKLNPDWEIFVYTPLQNYTCDAHYILDYTGKDYFYMIGDMGCVKMVEIDICKYGIDIALHNILRSDILRYHLLYDHGGVWSDFDVIWLQPMDHMNTIDCVGKVSMQDAAATVCLYRMTTGHHNIGILFGTPKHALYKSLINRAMEIQKKEIDRDKYNHQAFGATMWAELYTTLQDVIDAHFDVVGIPYETFAPYSIYNMKKLYKENDLSVINKNVIGLHWFNGHELSKRYVNEDWFGNKRKCSLTSILKSVGYVNV